MTVETGKLTGLERGLADENKRLRAALVSVKEWIMDPFGPDDFNSGSLHPAFLKALKKVHEALEPKRDVGA